MVKLPLGKLVKVNWLDHCGFEGWHNTEDALKLKPPAVTTVGYLIVVAEDWIVLASDITKEEVNGICLVLRNCIQSCTELTTA